jgi:HD-GYP domain-containing protein (c-di-GMP phosphodiesterase class II)
MFTDPQTRTKMLLEKIEGAFGVPFALWSPSDGWIIEPTHPVPTPISANDNGSFSIPTSQYLSILTRGEPFVTPAADNTSAEVYLPLPWSTHRSWLAIGRFQQIPIDTLTRWSQTFLQSHRLSIHCHDLEQQVAAAMNQISSDFEQHSYLRFLAEQIELCDVTRNVRHVVHRILPQLQRVISASSILFVPREARDTKTDSDNWVRFGSPPLPPAQCIDMIREFDPHLYRGPVVRNQGFPVPSSSDLPESVISFMMVAVEKENTSLGWILAFNRNPGFVAENEIDNGFGTVEAGLLQVTSIMIATHGRNLTLFHESEDLTVDAVRALVNAIDARDSYTRGHSERVGQLAKRLCQALNLSEEFAEQTYVAGLLHDIGKIGIADQILRKPGLLTTEEFDELKKHPVIGYQILRGLGKLSYVLPGVLHHHERIDGRGYPQGLAGESIPLQARILAIADGWDAMTSARPYRSAMPFNKAQQVLLEGSGSQWDPDLMRAFFTIIDQAKSIALSHQASADQLAEIPTESPATTSLPLSAETSSCN